LLYPLRPSELIHQPDFRVDIKPLSLTEEERREILEFEEPFYNKLEKLKDISVPTHTIYPEAFTTEEGRRIFAGVYWDDNLKEKLANLADEWGVSLENTEAERKVYDSFFDDLVEISGSGESYQSYLEKGAKFTKLESALKEISGRDGNVLLKGDNAGNLQELGKEENVEKFFWQIDLTSVPSTLRNRMNRYSSDWEKARFAQSFQQAEGNTQEILNPKRISRVVNIDRFTEKVQGLREFKNELKSESQRLSENRNNLNEAKSVVVNLYRRYVNVLIAKEYDIGQILALQPQRTQNEERAMELLRGSFRGDKGARTLERIDHFLGGVALEVGEKGLFKTLSERLSKYVEARAGQSLPTETSDYLKYNGYKVGSQEAAALAQKILDKYGFAEGDKPWKAVILERKGTLAVMKEKKEVRIPKSYRRGLVDTLTVLAHEVEGHVLRYKNQEENLSGGLRLVEELATGRSSILSEAAAMRIEDETRQKLVGMERVALPYYYLALSEKRSGGDFKECFQVFFEACAKRQYGLSLTEAVKDEKAFKEIFDYSYDRVLRIFRRNIPLDDKSGYLPTSEELDYIEQELVVDALKDLGLSKLLYVAGMDLYSLGDLTRLGMLNLENVKEPEMMVANEIWPRIKTGLDEGKSLAEILPEI